MRAPSFVVWRHVIALWLPDKVLDHLGEVVSFSLLVYIISIKERIYASLLRPFLELYTFLFDGIGPTGRQAPIMLSFYLFLFEMKDLVLKSNVRNRATARGLLI